MAHTYYMTFEQLELIEPIRKALKKEKYTTPTPIQAEAIPVVLDGSDLLGCAQTGTGKTAAFSIPIIQKIEERISRGRKPGIKALILTPTRELAIQIGESFTAYGRYTHVKHTVIFGGVGQKPQTDALERGVDVLIATPGRLLDLINQGFIRLDTLEYFVLDEADRMLDMGFYDDIMQVYKLLPATCQTIMFSATMPPKIRTLAQTILKNPEEVKIAISRPPETIMQTAYVCYDMQKLRILEDLFSKSRPQRVIIFSSSKMKVKELASTLKRMKFNVAAMHSDLEQSQREEVMKEFKNGRIDILVATDVVSRGIDINDIKLVINFDIPHDPEDYVHRIGRTGRAGSHGLAIMLATREDGRLVDAIEKLTKQTFEQKPLRPLSRQARSEMRRASGERPERRGEREIERVDTPEDERLAKERARAYVPPSHRNRDPIFDTPYRERSGASGKPEELRVFERETVRKPRQAAVLLCGFPRRRD